MGVLQDPFSAKAWGFGGGEYHQYDPEIDVPQTLEEYYNEYGFTPGQPGWEYLSDNAKDDIKEKRAPYQGFTEQERRQQREAWELIQQGSPADLERMDALISRYQMSPAIRKYLIGKIGSLLEAGPDYQDVYKAQKGKIDVAMRGKERGIMGRQAATGMLDSSATQARLGALQGEYGGALADLLLGTAELTERTREGRARTAGMLGAGMLQWQGEDVSRLSEMEAFRNLLYKQNLGFRGEALDYQAEERWRENMFNLQNIDPQEYLTLQSMLPGLLEFGASAYGTYAASQAGGAAG